MVRDRLFEATAFKWSDAQIQTQITQGIKDISAKSPRVVRIELDVEARTGSSTSTSANNLVDASKAHFLSTDVGKVIYNTTDYTWATIISYSSTSQVGLSKDIMASGEGYNIYNTDCVNSKQLYIGNIRNRILLYLTENKVEYYIQQSTPSYHNFKEIARNALEIMRDTTPITTYTKAAINFAMYHSLPNLTDYEGAVNYVNGYLAGSTSMALNGLQASGTIQEGTEFTVNNVRGTYSVTADATIATNAATISFYPGLESAVINTQVVTFTQSTLEPYLEEVLADYVAGLCCSNIATLRIHGSAFGDEFSKYLMVGRQYKEKALDQLPPLRIPYIVCPR